MFKRLKELDNARHKKMYADKCLKAEVRNGALDGTRDGFWYNSLVSRKDPDKNKSGIMVRLSEKFRVS